MRHRLTILAVVDDAHTLELLPKVVGTDVLAVVRDLGSALQQAERAPPDVAIVDVSLGSGGGLAMVHHLRTLVPQLYVVALASPEALEAGANALSLGGAMLLIKPLEGDEITTALEEVRTRIAEQHQRAALERSAMVQARTAGWVTRIVEQAAAADRAAAGRRIARVFVEVTAATGAALYLGGHGRASDLVMLAAALGDLEGAPSAGTQDEIFAFAARERLDPVALATGELRAGHVLLRRPLDAPRSPMDEDTLFLLVAQATTTLALVLERERSSHEGAIKDPSSSAYSFAYYVDVAGREIDKAKRFDRRFAIMTVTLDGADGSAPPDDGLGWEDRDPLDPAEVADHLLAAARETAVVARVDESEFQLLLPETDGLGAQATRRRIVARLSGRAPMRGVAVGAAIFPHDGTDLSQLLRVARRRSDASRLSAAHRIGPEVTRLDRVLDALSLARKLEGPETALRTVELPVADVVALVTATVSETLRGGATFVAVAQHSDLSLSAAVRAALPAGRRDVIVHSVDVRTDPGSEGVEALSLVGEHAAYAFVARHDKGTLRGVHASDPLIADLVADRIGRAGGLRVLS